MCLWQVDFESTPHARGSTSPPLEAHRFYPVYPACAGIHPNNRTVKKRLSCLPRMRGDPPEYDGSYCLFYESTPHARGSTFVDMADLADAGVYPACAGIHPRRQATEAPR